MLFGGSHYPIKVALSRLDLVCRLREYFRCDYKLPLANAKFARPFWRGFVRLNKCYKKLRGRIG